jgi:hypothetical protein
VWLLIGGTAPLESQAPQPARADSAWDAGHRDLARQLYADIVRQDPAASRAVFRLAVVTSPADSALRLYQRYTELEPADEWGWLALGDQLVRMGRLRAAARAFEEGLSVASDAETREELEARLQRARRLSAPAIELTGAGSGDSDQYRTLGGGVQLDFAVTDGARLGFRARRQRATEPGGEARVDDGTVTLSLRPRAAWRIDLQGGAARLGAPAGGASATRAHGDARVRWRGGTGRPAVEFRAQHLPLAVTPLLVANRVMRTEGRLALEFPAGRWRLRGTGRAASLEAIGIRNTRLGIDGALALQVAPSTELSAQYHRIGFADPSTLGFFAPKRSEIVEAGSYHEIGGDGPLLVALELGGGAQRITPHGEPTGAWGVSLRGYAYAVWTLAPARELRLEAEGYNAPGLAVASVSADDWRYVSVMIGMRVGF